MKKVFVLCLCLCTLMITGCGCNKKDEIVIKKCSNSTKNEDFNYEVNYSFESKKNVMKKYIRKEKYTSDNNEVIENMNKYKNDYFSSLSDFKEIKFETNVSDGVLETTLTIDFSKINQKKLFEKEPFYINFYNDEEGIIDVNYAIEYYEGDNLSCS